MLVGNQERNAADATMLMNMGYPVPGRPMIFDELSSKFLDIRSNVLRIDSDLCAIRVGDSDSFKGDAADVFAASIDNASVHLDDLESICKRISRLFSDHARELRVLQSRADQAIARARVCWNEKADARLVADKSAGVRDMLNRQLESISAVGDIETQNEVLRELRDVNTRYSDAVARETRALQGLESERDLWHDLGCYSEDLDERTASDMRALDLGSLADPSFFEQVREGIASLVEFSTSFIDEHLEVIHEILDVVLAVLVFASIFFPFCPILFLAVAAVALLKLAVGWELYSQGRMSFVDLIFDIIDLWAIGSQPQGLILKSLSFLYDAYGHANTATIVLNWGLDGEPFQNLNILDPTPVLAPGYDPGPETAKISAAFAAFSLSSVEFEPIVVKVDMPMVPRLSMPVFDFSQSEAGRLQVQMSPPRRATLVPTGF